MGAWELLQDLTVATNSTSVVLNDFGTITKDDFVKVVVTTIGAGQTNNPISLFANNDTSNTNYFRQNLQGSGSAVSASRTNDSEAIFTTPTTSNALNIIYIKLSENDKFNYFTNNMLRMDSSLVLRFDYVTSITSFSSGITSLTFTNARTNGIGTGSRIQIYKLAATKVEDITVASNTTQVDISSLSIDKDSEYLLVGYIDSGNLDGRLAINDNITMNTYHSQRISGNGSTTSAARSNEPFFAFANSGTQVLFYAHIKLSNIGAYTYQCYTLRNIGTTTPQLINFFGSSTAENITSITKLNIVSVTSGSIKAGSRFELYKLYE